MTGQPLEYLYLLGLVIIATMLGESIGLLLGVFFVGDTFNAIFAVMVPMQVATLLSGSVAEANSPTSILSNAIRSGMKSTDKTTLESQIRRSANVLNVSEDVLKSIYNSSSTLFESLTEKSNLTLIETRSSNSFILEKYQLDNSKIFYSYLYLFLTYCYDTYRSLSHPL